VFLPIGLLVSTFIFFFNIFAFPYSQKNALPDSALGITLMIIPVIIFAVFWFVYQSRYNVEKSGGKLSIGMEYMNFFIYYLIYSVVFLMVLVIPLSNYIKVYLKANPTELKEDIKHLNKGNTIFYNAGTLVDLKNGYYKYPETYFTYYYDYSYKTDWSNYYDNYDTVTVSKKQIFQIIENFKIAFNKYTNYPITHSPEIIIQNNLDNIYVYYGEDQYDYSYKNNVSYKINELNRRIINGWLGDFQEKWFYQVILGIIAFFTLLTWIFKQIHWKTYVFGLVALALTPLVMSVFFLIIDFLLYSGGRISEKIFLRFVLFLYLVIGTFSIRGYILNRKNYVGIVSTMYLQFFLPMLPLFLIAVYNERILDNEFDIIYYVCWGIGLLSILLFKFMYRKMSLLPAKK